jgi:GxxExxY protein
MALYKQDEYYKIIGLCMEVNRILGGGLLEAVYKEALEIEF